MSVTDLPLSPPVATIPIASVALDPDFERRWSAWQARGAARSRALARRLVGTALVLGLGTFVAAVVYVLLFS